MSLPLEVRHTIFEYAAARNIKPKKLLRYWFEKKEVKELVAQHVAADPNGPAPRVVQNDQYEEESSDVPELEDLEDQDSEDEGEEAADGEDDGGSDDNGDDDEGDVDDMGQAQADEDDNFNDEEEDENVADGHVEPADASQAQSTPHVPVSLEDEDDAVDGSTEDVHLEGEPVTDISPHDPDEHGDEAIVEAAGDEADVDIEDGVEEADNDVNANSAANAPPPPPAPAPVLRAARKWRYIPNFMRMTHCPPPVELLLTSKQLNDEAKNWFYDVAVLRINATGSFAHTSFFEEAFSQITEAAFSPMENVRKVDVTFAWDTTWLRADTTGCAEAIFPALLRQRSDFVRQILSQAPDLREVIVHWHDSAQDDESANFMLDILAPFHGLNANIKIEEHYITADAKPHKRSIAGQRRLEFQNIIDAGLDRLF
ncbi:hypothetical protein FB567DRAFT_564244 [Paraphoma chrysanthemicola]|uniref:Uncharacterized protein n=1 Tax=Paraphoma chrysanthemicola TaxID=798071 RepID=A0A8K0QUY6_9PLEO|nr:hypothetical protein FB567DRAFT_564244 [Paraphoma chrysanthemicola]